jgi:hypothetical protein
MITIRGEKAYPAIILQGSGNKSVINAGGASRVLYIDSGNKVTLKNLTLADGRANNGAGIYTVDGVVIADEGSVIKGNTAERGSGGGLYLEQAATFTMSGNAAIKNNTARNGGGVLITDNARLILQEMDRIHQAQFIMRKESMNFQAG